MHELPRYITHYWGKTASEDVSPVRWHPVAYHCLDVAAVMEALLLARPQWLDTLVALTELPREEVRLRLLLSSCLHDLGKYAENFQLKVPELTERLNPDSKYGRYVSGHGSVGAALWDILSDRLSLSSLDPWMLAAMSHHGMPVSKEELLRNALSPSAKSDAFSFCADVFTLFGTPTEASAANETAWIWEAAGLFILADWIGSNQKWFPCQSPTDALGDYWEQARHKASHALLNTDLAEAAPAATFDLSHIFPFSVQPSPLQAWAAHQAPSREPQLYIIEDLTGAGKTEAALILCHRLMKAGCAEGIYWALPSMATANSLYARLEAAYQKLFDCSSVTPSLVLAHSARDLNTSFQLSVGANSSYDSSDTDESVTAESYCASFIAEDRKKTFLAQVGVGTLDQALLGVLPVRHQSLRLAALSRRILVIDEAHAYDPYMTEGLEKLLTFQKQLGGSALILSATLPEAHRKRFVRAYAEEADAVTNNGFPLSTHVTPHHLDESEHLSVRGTRRDLPCLRFSTPEEAMDALIEKARDGFCGVYIRNTVKDAIQAYAYSHSRWKKTDFFHARFCLGDRMEKENRVLSLFGKSSTPKDRCGRILIATQVVEQSLDLDFDFMVTDLCPMDLLIQRAGRLHRHTRTERPAPVLWIVSQAATDDITEDWYARLFPAGSHVYPHVGQLWRTLRVIEQKKGLPLLSASPRDLIESVFGPDALPYPQVLDKASSKAEAKDTADKAVAHLNFLCPGGFKRENESWDEDIYTPTRLGDPTVTLRLARWVEGRLLPWMSDPVDSARSWRLSEIAVPARICTETRAPDKAAQGALDAQIQEWHTRHNPPMILALKPVTHTSESTPLWEGRMVTAKQEEVIVSYSTEFGLKYN